MTAVFNVVSNGAKVARIYFELDPTGQIFAASILCIQRGLLHGESRTLEGIQKWARDQLDVMFGGGRYTLQPSVPAEREEYEKAIYEVFGGQQAAI